jgi:hypothetical protein
LASFDETAPSVFGCLCRLTAGDADRAIELLIDTYVELGDSATAATASESAPALDVAHRVFLAHAAAAPVSVHEIEPVALLTPIERVLADLDLVQHRRPSAIDLPVDQRESALEAACAKLAIAGSSTALGDVLRRCEVWFDDTMRANARERLADRIQADRGHRGEAGLVGTRNARRRTNVLVGVASAIVGAALVTWVMTANRDEENADARTPVPTLTASPSPSASASASDEASIATTVAPPSTNAAPSTSTSSPGDASIATDAPTTTIAEPVGYILTAIPEGFTPLAAFSDATGDDVATFWHALWSTDGATRTSGQWFAVAVHAEERRAKLSVNGTLGAQPIVRIRIADRSALVSVDPDGVQHTTVSIDDDRVIEFTSFGVSIEQISTLVSAATIGSDNAVTFGPAATEAYIAGMSIRIATPTVQSTIVPIGFSKQDSAAIYGTADHSTLIAVTSGPQQADDLLAASLLLEPSDQPGAPVPPERSIQISGRTALVGQWDLVDGRDTQMVVWHEGGRTISVRGTVGLDVLLAAAESVRLATPEEWRELVEIGRVATDTNSPDTNSPDTSAAVPHVAQIGSTITTAGSTWSIQLTDEVIDDISVDRDSDGLIRLSETLPAPAESSYQSTSEDAYPILLDPANPLTHFETLDSTVLVVVLRDPTDAVFMRVTIDSSKRIDVPIVPVVGSDLSGAAYAFSEALPFTVELLDANGAVVQSLMP